MAGRESRANEVTIGSVVTSFVHGRSEGGYVAAIVVGVAGALGVWWFAPRYWRLALLLLWVATLALWGLVARVAAEPASSSAWLAARRLAGALALLATLGLLAIALTWVMQIG